MRLGRLAATLMPVGVLGGGAAASADRETADRETADRETGEAAARGPADHRGARRAGALRVYPLYRDGAYLVSGFDVTNVGAEELSGLGTWFGYDFARIA